MLIFASRNTLDWKKNVSPVIQSILTLGIEKTTCLLTRRNILICNALSFVLILTTAIMYVFVHVSIDYFRPISWYFNIIIIVFIIPLLLNKYGYNLASRLVLSCAPPLLTIGFSILSKLTIENFTFNDYHNFRIALIVFCNIPFFLFSLSEKLSLTISFFVNFLCLALTDVIHHLFNVGYYDIGFEDTHYNFINGFSMIASLPIVCGILIFKGIIEKQIAKNEKLVSRLRSSNSRITIQNHRLQSQKEKLEEGELQLKHAYDTIANQKYLLEEELVMYDHEVSQFSYNVCHHLKGPAATLSGLVNIIEQEMTGTSDKNLIGHFKISVKRLEQVISDLNLILNIRRDIFRQKSHILIEHAIAQALELLNDDIRRTRPVIKMNIIKGHKIFVPQGSVIDMLCNLLSNSIKYRDPSRQLIIEIRSAFDDNGSLIEIRDNGLGIDLSRFGDDLFKMYKRFHLHTEGKGLGLYLVKLQVSALGGTIIASSKENEYTKFTLSLPNDDDAPVNRKGNDLIQIPN